MPKGTKKDGTHVGWSKGRPRGKPGTNPWGYKGRMHSPLEPETLNYIFDEISTSKKSVSSIVKDLDLNFGHVCRTIHETPELEKRLHDARKMQADFIVESVFDRLDTVYKEIRETPFEERHKANAIAQVARLEIDSIKWIACKFKPETYGEKIAVNHSVEEIGAKLKEMFVEGRITAKPAGFIEQKPLVSVVNPAGEELGVIVEDCPQSSDQIFEKITEKIADKKKEEAIYEEKIRSEEENGGVDDFDETEEQTY